MSSDYPLPEGVPLSKTNAFYLRIRKNALEFRGVHLTGEETWALYHDEAVKTVCDDLYAESEGAKLARRRSRKC